MSIPDRFVICPHCKGSIDATNEGKSFECPHCLKTVRTGKPFPWWKVVIAAASLVIGIPVFLGLQALYNHLKSDLPDILGGAIASVFVIGIGTVVVIVCLAWLLFPVFMYLKMDQLIAEVRKIQR